MEQGFAESLLSRLLRCTSSNDLRSILQDIGDSDASTIDVPFGRHGLVWRPFGGTASNVSSIGLGTKPGRSMTERITNAIDAVLEDRAITEITPPTSPRQAAARWYGRPISGPDSGLFSWKDMPDGFDRHVHVVMHPSEKADLATIDLVDDGIGIVAEDFHSTILSLQRGNKIQKRHLIGAFGQGGAATLGFCDYALMFSRPRARPNTIAFTVIRVLHLDISYKEDCYAYLAVADSAPDVRKVLEVDASGGAFNPYDAWPAARLPEFTQGTIVRHIGYRLLNLDKALHASPGNLYHYLHFSMFDPLIPFRIVDLRGANARNEYVGGTRNRLMTRVKQSQEPSDDDDERNIHIRHYRPMEYIAPSGSTEPCIGIEYWVVLAFKKKGEEYELRGHSNELFVEQGRPIIGTLNGQNQGEATAQLLKQINLSLLSRHIVIHVDATNADSRVRRELFATNREGFKD